MIAKDIYLNSDLRLEILNMVVRGKGGHIPSSYSIVDIINVIYRDYNVIRNQTNNQNPNIFILKHSVLLVFLTWTKSYKDKTFFLLTYYDVHSTS